MRKIDSFLTHTTGTDSVRLHKVLSEAQRRACESGEPVPDETALPDA